MDELDAFWDQHFGVAASLFERRLLIQISTTIPPGDPLFVLTAMLTRQLYLALGGKEKAILEFGPAVTEMMKNLAGATETISSDLSAILNQIGRVRRNMDMLDARLIDQRRNLAQRVTERATAIVDGDLKTMLQWIVSLCLAFIAGVVAVTIWSHN